MLGEVLVLVLVLGGEREVERGVGLHRCARVLRGACERGRDAVFREGAHRCDAHCLALVRQEPFTERYPVLAR